MANITAVLKAASGNSQRGRNVYYMDNVIDLTANSINPNGAYAPQIAITGLTASTSADTIDVLLAGGGASFTAGKIRVYAMMMDISDQGDMSADEVDRDTLA